jgi:hypothetical protein
LSNKVGAKVMPHVPAPGLHELLDAVEDEVIASHPALRRFVPPRAASPWLHHEGEWWPQPDDAGSQGPGGEPNAEAVPVPGPTRT